MTTDYATAYAHKAGLFAGIQTLSRETEAGRETTRLVSLTLSGGGPGSWVDFEFDLEDDEIDAEPLRGVFYWSEAGTVTPVNLTTDEAAALWRALNSDPSQCGACGDDLVNPGDEDAWGPTCTESTTCDWGGGPAKLNTITQDKDLLDVCPDCRNDPNE